MDKEVSNSHILQAITELTGQVRDLTEQMEQTEERLNRK